MRKIIALLIFALTFSAYAQMAKSEKEVLSILSTIGKEKQIVLKEVRTHIDQAYKALDRVVDYIGEKPTDKMMEEAIRVAIYAASLDTSHQSGEMVLDIYLKHRDRFEKALKNFPSEKAKLLKIHIDAAHSEQKAGNG